MFINLTPPAVGIQADLDETIRLATRHGFAGIDLPLEEVAALADPDQAGAKLEDAGLRWGGFGLPTEFRRDEATFEQDLARLKRWAPVAQRLGCQRTYSWIVPGHNELDNKANFDFLARRLRPIAELLAEHEIRIGLEFIGPKTLRDTFRYPFIYTIAGMLELCAAAAPRGSNNVGVLLDCYHWYTSGATEADLLDLLDNESIVYVHVNDGVAGRGRDEQMDLERALPCDTGVIDAATFVRAINKLSYDGPVTAEPFVAELAKQPADEVAARVAASIRKCLSPFC